MLVCALACAWAWAPSLVTLATDGIPASEYEGYNNIGYVMLAVLLMVVLVVAAAAVYVMALSSGRPLWQAFLLSQLPGLLVASAATALLGSA
jgi:hypothetical protein